MRIAFLGLGLIGGSVARAVRAGGIPGAASGGEPSGDEPSGGPPRLVAWTERGAGPRAALAAGIIDEVAATPGAAIEGADLVVLATPPLACVAMLSRLGRDGDLRASLAPGATVTDVASTKAAILAAARRAGVPFVGGHPMAGRETSGFEASDGDLLRERPWVVTEAVNGGDPERVRVLARACGARTVELDAATHDRLVAAISHLPLLTAVALVEAVTGGDDAAADWPAAAPLAASGWRDTTRLARGDVTMGTEIAVTNAPAIAARLRDLRSALDAWIEILEAPGGPDATAIRHRLAAARRRLEG
ncbi:MAG: prephenate dehydrogenase/arogenate dehydrogenase family protein [Chloroflexota bacterium]